MIKVCSQDKLFNAEEYLLVLGKNIQKIREKQNLTISKLSELSHYDRSCLAKFERGEHNIKIVTVIKLARVLDVPFPALFSRNFETKIEEGTKHFQEDDYLRIFVENFRRKQIFLRQPQMKVLILTGLNEVTVSNIIQRKNTNPTVKTLSAMAFSIQTEMSELFARTN